MNSLDNTCAVVSSFNSSDKAKKKRTEKEVGLAGTRNDWR